MSKLKAIVCISLSIFVASTNAAIQEETNTSEMSHAEILTHMMTAEMAMQRNVPEEALKEYMLVIKHTDDPEIARITTELAIELQDFPNATIAAEVWANLDTQDLQAQLVAVTLLVGTAPSKSIEFLNRCFEIGNNDVDEHLLAILNKLSPASRNHLTESVFRVAENRKQDPYAQLAAAQLAANQLQIERAEAKLVEVFAIKKDITNAIELQAKLIRHKKDSDQPALEYLDQQVANYPRNSELRMFYVSALTDNNQAEKAIPHLESLSKDPEFGGEALLLIAENFISESKYELAEQAITKALKFPESEDKARYYLAQIAEYNGDTQKAITWYESISETSMYNVSAYLRAAFLYSLEQNYSQALAIIHKSSPSTFIEQKQILLTEIDLYIESGQVEQALSLANQTLEVIPEDVDFLYARSIIFSLNDNYRGAETDLRMILQLEPNHANALNALGYSLLNQPSRLEEAMPYLQKAMDIMPNNPAFMDSMGWLLYKQGKFEESIKLLREAYKLSQDAEIAAHFGEVLWKSGNQEEAKSVWLRATESFPEDEALLETLKKFNVPLQ